MITPTINGVKQYFDTAGNLQREVCADTKAGRAEYGNRLTEMAMRQTYRCALTVGALYAENTTFDHEAGRGLGGAHRDDRIEVDGHWQNAAVTLHANTLKGSRRYKWIEGTYQEVSQ